MHVRKTEARVYANYKATETLVYISWFTILFCDARTSSPYGCTVFVGKKLKLRKDSIRRGQRTGRRQAGRQTGPSRPNFGTTSPT